MLEHRIQQHFIDSADLKYQASEALGVPIAQAVHAIVACVTGGGKTLACGNGASATLAQTLAAAFVGGFERERPELAALSLTLDGALLTVGGLEPDNSVVFARQVRAMGHAGDVLVALSPGGNCANVIAAIAAAHERDMTVVAMTGRHGGRIAGMLRETDVHIGVPHDRMARVHEVHLLAIHCICDGVDAQLLGDPET